MNFSRSVKEERRAPDARRALEASGEASDRKEDAVAPYGGRRNVAAAT